MVSNTRCCPGVREKTSTGESERIFGPYAGSREAAVEPKAGMEKTRAAPEGR